MLFPVEQLRELNAHLTENTVGLSFFAFSEHEPLADPLGLDLDPTPEPEFVLRGAVTADKTTKNGRRKVIMIVEPLPKRPDGTWWVTAANDASGTPKDGAVPGRIVDDDGPSVGLPTSQGTVSTTIHVTEGAV